MLTLERIDPRTTALLTVDVQNDFCAEGGFFDHRGFDLTGIHGAVDHLVGFLPAVRAVGVPPVFVRAHYDREYWSDAMRERVRRNLGEDEEHCRSGTWGAEFFRVGPEPGEEVVTKHRYSGFIGTGLDDLLRGRGIENLLLAGITSNVCVESTARDGFMLDYHIVFLEDCTAAPDPDSHRATLVNIRRFFGIVATTGDVTAIWRDAGLLR